MSSPAAAARVPEAPASQYIREVLLSPDGVLDDADALDVARELAAVLQGPPNQARLRLKQERARHAHRGGYLPG